MRELEHMMQIHFLQNTHASSTAPTVYRETAVRAYSGLQTTCKTSEVKAVPLQVWSGSEGSRKLRFPDFMTTAQDGGKVVSLTHRSPLPPGNAPGTHFC